MCSCNREFPIDRSTSCVFSLIDAPEMVDAILEKSSLRNHSEKKEQSKQF